MKKQELQFRAKLWKPIHKHGSLPSFNRQFRISQEPRNSFFLVIKKNPVIFEPGEAVPSGGEETKTFSERCPPSVLPHIQQLEREIPLYPTHSQLHLTPPDPCTREETFATEQALHNPLLLSTVSPAHSLLWMQGSTENCYRTHSFS